MNQKDYYKILDIQPEAGEVEIKKAYRRMALQYHPDRNAGNIHAEEQFKEINEAYAILGDPQKKSQYDQFRRYGFDQQYTETSGFHYSQEDILRDLFKNPYTNQIFQELMKEFQRMGFHFDQNFIDKTFFGGKGTFFGGVFFTGPFAKHDHRTYHFREKPIYEEGRLSKVQRPTLGQKVVDKVGNYLLKKLTGVDAAKTKRPTGARGKDIFFNLTVSPNEAKAGGHIELVYPRGKRKERLTVKIPQGIRSGTKLRLKGKGTFANDPQTAGDLYLHITIQ